MERHTFILDLHVKLKLNVHEVANG